MSSERPKPEDVEGIPTDRLQRWLESLGYQFPEGVEAMVIEELAYQVLQKNLQRSEAELEFFGVGETEARDG